MEIITAGVQDYQVIHGLAARIWPETYKNILSEEQIKYMFSMMYSQESYEEQITAKGHQFLLAKKNDVFIGYASFEPDYKEDTVKIHKLYVLPEVQGSGAGKKLVKAIESIAFAAGNSRITLNVNRYNPAVKFYTKAGFTKTGEEDISIGNGYLMEDYIMEKQL